MKVRFWFFYENEMQRRPILFDIHPLRMKIKEFNDHIDKVFEAQAIVAVRKCRWINSFLRIAKRVVNARAIMATHYRRWIECRFYQQPWVGKTRISQGAEPT